MDFSDWVTVSSALSRCLQKFAVMIPQINPIKSGELCVFIASPPPNNTTYYHKNNKFLLSEL